MKDTLTREDVYRIAGDLEEFRDWLDRSVVYTPGVEHVAEAGRAYWLIVAIGAYLTPRYLAPLIAKDPCIGELSFWRLTVAEDRSALLEARTDSDCEPFVTRAFDFTDFPFNSIDIWAGFNGTTWTLFLPDEY